VKKAILVALISTCLVPIMHANDVAKAEEFDIPFISVALQPGYSQPLTGPIVPMNGSAPTPLLRRADAEPVLVHTSRSDV
jgi:hypothetical protein